MAGSQSKEKAPTPETDPQDEAAAPTHGETPEPPSATHGAEDETWETAGDDTPHLEDEVVRLRDRVKELESEVGLMKEKWLRARADYDNLTRRTDAERDRLALQAAARVIGELLDPLDVLARAAADAEGVDDPHAEGIRLTHRNLWKALEREGLKEVPGAGAPFDVNVHEAIARTASEHPEGTIAEVVRPGYLLGERLLRASLVKVSEGPATDPDDTK